MKILLTVVVMLCTTVVCGQQCKCETDTSLNNIISCEIIQLKNHSKIYWQFNCDSSWLTFESKSGVKEILYALDAGMMDYTGRLGFQYETEYKTTFLIRNNLISGCCTPPEFILFNKSNGKYIKNVGPLIYYNDSLKYPLMVSINYKGFNELKFYNVETKRQFSILLPPNKIANTLKMGGETNAEYLFEGAGIIGNIFSVSFRYKKPGNNDKWYNYKIVVNLTKYGY